MSQNKQNKQSYSEKREYEFENLVFEGGGVRCIAYVGAVKVLEKKGIMKQIKRVAGASGGAILAALLSVGYTYRELYRELIGLEFKDVKDKDYFPIFNLIRLYKNFGWYKGDEFEKWFRNILSKKIERDITFSELYKLRGKQGIRELYIIGSDLNTQKEIVFSHETFPDMPIATAVRISMSFPLVFEAVNYNNSLFTDGGLYFNYPINLFDNTKYITNEKTKKDEFQYNGKTLGFRIHTKREIYALLGKENLPPRKINSISDYIQVIIEGIFNLNNKQFRSNQDNLRTIFIDCKGVSPLKFNIPLQLRKKLIKSGENAAKAYFEWYENPTKERIIV